MKRYILLKYFPQNDVSFGLQCLLMVNVMIERKHIRKFQSFESFLSIISK